MFDPAVPGDTTLAPTSSASSLRIDPDFDAAGQRLRDAGDRPRACCGGRPVSVKTRAAGSPATRVADRTTPPRAPDTSAAPPRIDVLPGRHYPLGATPRDGGTNFAVASSVADGIALCLFDE